MELNDIELDVMVIGNGPSGISLSYMLSGWTPYFKPTGLSDEDLIQMRLNAVGRETALTEVNLAEVSEGLEGRASNPVALLFDHLSHPYADMGLNIPSQIEWLYKPERALSHLVIGKSDKPGGVWQSIHGDMKTLSKGSWMELPHYTFKQYLTDRGLNSTKPTDRATVVHLKEYYEHYVKVNKLTDNFLNNAVITSVEKASYPQTKVIDRDTGEYIVNHTGSQLWQCSGYINSSPDEKFTIRARNIVLAVGTSDVPKHLCVNSDNIPYVRYSQSNFDEAFSGTKSGDTVMVVGSGLSASDMLLEAKKRGLNAIHVFRDTPCGNPKQIMKKLPRSVYPEYVWMYELMCGDAEADWYHGYPHHIVDSFFEKGNVLLVNSKTDTKEIVNVSVALIQIGLKPELGFLPSQGMHLGVSPFKKIDSRHNPIDVNPFTYESVVEPGLYAMGPLVGDTFVRFIQGGAIAITKHIQAKHNIIAL